MQLILNATLSDIEDSLTTIYEDHANLLHFLSQAGLPKPPALTLAAGFAVNAGLRRALEADPVDQPQVRSYLSLATADQVSLETPTLSYLADQRMKRAMVELQDSSGSLEMLDRALSMARMLAELPFELNLWQAQNIWYEIQRTSSYALTALSAAALPTNGSTYRPKSADGLIPAARDIAARVAPGGVGPDHISIRTIGPSIGPHVGPGALGGVVLLRR